MNNPLYAFLTNAFTFIKSEKNLDRSQIFFRRSKEGSNYVIYELPFLLQKINSEYYKFFLESHHISVYEKYGSGLFSNQYHYTAYFVDQTQRKYQLHVYFDRNDQLSSVMLTTETDKEEWTKVNVDEDLAEVLIQHAIDKCAESIAELRKQHQQYIVSITKTYLELEKALTSLSIELNEKREDYFALLIKIISTLEVLVCCVEDFQFKKLLKLYQQIAGSFESSVVESETQNEEDLVEVNSNETAISENARSYPKKRNETNIRSILVEALKAKENFISSQNSSYSDQLSAFFEFDMATSNALLCTENQTLTPSGADLQTIRQFMVDVNVEGKKLLEKLLLNNQFQDAAALKKFANPVPEKLFKIALTTGNAELLDFLLSNAPFPINTFIVANNLTPILFCFYNHNQNFSKVDCLSVLIKHNASIMVKARDGLPVAHHILSSLTHPLKRALIANTEVTLGRPGFYKKLITMIQNYIENNVLSDETKAELMTAITMYKIAIENIPKDSLFRNEIVRRDAESLEALRAEVKNPKLMLDLQRDKDLQVRFVEYNRLKEIYLSKLSVQEKLIRSKESDQFNESFDLPMESYMRDPNIKTHLLSSLEERITDMKLKIEACDIREELKQGVHSKPKLKAIRNKREKILLAHSNTLPTVNLSLSAYQTSTNLKYTPQMMNFLTEYEKARNDYKIRVDAVMEIVKSAYASDGQIVFKRKELLERIVILVESYKKIANILRKLLQSTYRQGNQIAVNQERDNLNLMIQQQEISRRPFEFLVKLLKDSFNTNLDDKKFILFAADFIEALEKIIKSINPEKKSEEDYSNKLSAFLQSSQEKYDSLVQSVTESAGWSVHGFFSKAEMAGQVSSLEEPQSKPFQNTSSW